MAGHSGFYLCVAFACIPDEVRKITFSGAYDKLAYIVEITRSILLKIGCCTCKRF